MAKVIRLPRENDAARVTGGLPLPAGAAAVQAAMQQAIGVPIDLRRALGPEAVTRLTQQARTGGLAPIMGGQDPQAPATLNVRETLCMQVTATVAPPTGTATTTTCTCSVDFTTPVPRVGCPGPSCRSLTTPAGAIEVTLSQLVCATIQVTVGVNGQVTGRIVNLICAPCATFPILQTFGTSTAPDWVLGGSARLTSGAPDPTGSGWLRLTDALADQVGFAYYDLPFPSSQGIVVTFDYAAYGGTGGDGISFFLFDGSTTNFQIGPFGGSLGYAAVPSLNRPGLSNAYVGIGLDEFGNFTNPGPTGFMPDGPGFFPRQVAIRGPGNGLDGYLFVARADDPLIPCDRSCGRGVRISITGDHRATVEMRPDPTRPYQVLLDGVQLPAPTSATLKLGFAGSTGGQTNIHEIRNVVVEALG